MRLTFYVVAQLVFSSLSSLYVYGFLCNLQAEYSKGSSCQNGHLLQSVYFLHSALTSASVHEERGLSITCCLTSAPVGAVVCIDNFYYAYHSAIWVLALRVIFTVARFIESFPNTVLASDDLNRVNCW